MYPHGHSSDKGSRERELWIKQGYILDRGLRERELWIEQG